MYLPDFDYYCPDSLKEACEILARFGSRAKVIAGGTDLLSKMKQDLLAPEVIVSLKNIRELGTIQDVEGKGVVIGARATHNDLVDSSILQRRYPSVSEAAHTLANNQVRNRGTVGGNIVNAVPSADLPPILIALDATVTLVGPGGTRTLPLEQFFTGPGQIRHRRRRDPDGNRYSRSAHHRKLLLQVRASPFGRPCRGGCSCRRDHAGRSGEGCTNCAGSRSPHAHAGQRGGTKS